MDEFLKAIKDTAQKLLLAKGSKITLLHHNDADGLSSGSAAAQSLVRAGFSIFRYCLEKPYPQVMKRILDEPGGPVILVDFGSGMTKVLSELNKHGRDLILLDHHAVEEGFKSNINLVNPILFGIDGSSECTASSVAYLFAVFINPLNEDLLPLALIGALGDDHWNLKKEPKGVHKVIYDEAIKIGALKKGDDGEIFIKNRDKWIEADEIVNALNSLGSFGYFKGGTDTAIKGLEEGFDERYLELANSFREEFDLRLNELRSSLQLRNKGENIIWFDLRDSLSQFGVKSVGLVCERFLSEGNRVGPESILVGFQHIPSFIPGLGAVVKGETKLSVRLGSSIALKAEKEESLRVSSFLPKSIKSVGGFVDACHKHSGAATVKIGEEERLLAALETIL